MIHTERDSLLQHTSLMHILAELVHWHVLAMGAVCWNYWKGNPVVTNIKVTMCLCMISREL